MALVEGKGEAGHGEGQNPRLYNTTVGRRMFKEKAKGAAGEAAEVV